MLAENVTTAAGGKMTCDVRVRDFRFLFGGPLLQAGLATAIPVAEFQANRLVRDEAKAFQIGQRSVVTAGPPAIIIGRMAPAMELLSEGMSDSPVGKGVGIP